MNFGQAIWVAIDVLEADAEATESGEDAAVWIEAAERLREHATLAADDDERDGGPDEHDACPVHEVAYRICGCPVPTGKEET